MSLDLRTARTYPWHVILPVVLYLLLTLAGITGSSIGVDQLRQDPNAPTGIMLGSALTNRSDEYLTSTPIDIGVTATGSTATSNPLTAGQEFFTQLPSGPVSSIVLLDGTTLRAGTFLPDAMLVAARWWLPFLLLLLAAPPFFREITGSRWIGYFAAALILFSPSTAWWSFSQVEILGFAIAGAAALQVSARDWVTGTRWRAVGWGSLAALLLARTPLYYQPWAIVLVSAVAVVTLAALLIPKKDRRGHLIVVSGTLGLTAVLLGAVVLENLDSIRASLNTLYPGARVATGGPNGFQEIFAATNLGSLRDVTEVIGSNQSEISSSFAVAAVWAIILLAHHLGYRSTAHRSAGYAMAAVSTFWFAWATIEFGMIGTHIPLANLVPAGRAADVLGYLAIILLCLCLPALANQNGIGFALLAAIVTAGVAANAGSLLRGQNIPEISVRYIWWCALLLAAVVFVITYRPRHWAGYSIAGLLAFSLVWNVNPVLVGLGDLRGTPVAQLMLTEGDVARANGTVWAADAYALDSLMIATGVPSLSGRQMSGPNVDEWLQLDPTRSYEENWNRGGSYIWISWTEDPTLTMSNPSPDVISVLASPCVLSERVPELATIVSTQQLHLSCLTEQSTFDWAGTHRWVYSVNK